MRKRSEDIMMKRSKDMMKKSEDMKKRSWKKSKDIIMKMRGGRQVLGRQRMIKGDMKSWLRA